jgi:hypothetical protein
MGFPLSCPSDPEDPQPDRNKNEQDLPDLDMHELKGFMKIHPGQEK